MPQLGVNIDHVATVRQARRGDEPDPVRAAHEAELGGADGITVHLREDRRHIQDRDVRLLRELVKVKFNLEMAATDEMVRIAELKPHTAMLVPEGRQEITTEGGLNVAADLPRLTSIVKTLKSDGIIVSAFIEPSLEQVEACHAAGFDVCEVHTGPYAGHAFASTGGDFRRQQLNHELQRVLAAGEAIRERRMRFNAGHALNYHNVQAIVQLPGIEELHIGHAIVSRAIYVGLRDAVRDMKALLNQADFGALP